MTKEEILTLVESYKFTISAIEQLNFSISRTMTPDRMMKLQMVRGIIELIVTFDYTHEEAYDLILKTF
jgi:hypothetical protein